MYFYYQIEGKEAAWREALAAQRESIVEQKRPRYTTVLELDTLILDTHSREDVSKVKYRGPFYIDWDAPDIDTAIARVRQFMGKLTEQDVDLDSIAWFASGSRGFHAEIPMAVFMPKPKAQQYLPQIYREMLYEVYVDTMDLRVYSARKGRMWRTPNVQRENGKYKVPVTARELREMSAEDYEELIQAPREVPALTAPQLNNFLSVCYAKAEQKITEGAKKRGNSQRDVKLLARFKGQFPPTLQKLMSGEAVKPGTGFQQLALQIGITANALGKNVEETLTLCEGLIENHQSDSLRYNTPAKRRSEIARMHYYTQDNVCYEFSAGAIKSITDETIDTGDLDGISAEAGAVIASTADDNDDGLLQSLTMRETGFYRKTEDGAIKIWDLSFRDIGRVAALDGVSGMIDGYEADVYLRGERMGRFPLELRSSG